MNNLLSQEFKDKNVLIVGGTRGIGKEITQYFIDSHSNVFLTHRGSHPFNNQSITAIKFDLEKDCIETMLEENFSTSKSNGQIDILINNAGCLIEESLESSLEESWDKIFNINTKFNFMLCQKSIKYMKENGGRIVLASSFASTMPSYKSGIYAASKAALTSLVKSMAAEWAKYNINVNCYSPGVVPTDMTQPKIDKFKDKMLLQIAANKLGTSGEIVDTISFLASSLSQYITGENINVTGGKFIIQNPNGPWEDQ